MNEMFEPTRNPGAGGPERLRQALIDCELAFSAVVDRFRRLEPRQLAPDGWLELRADVGRLLREVFASMRLIDDGMGLSDVHRRLHQYLEHHRGDVVENDALMGVGGTLEWARRLREHADRNELPLTRGPDGGLRPGQYRLEA